jgi:hypothetical protein
MQPQHPSKTQQPIKVIGKHKFYDIRQADQILRTRYMVAEIQEIFIRSGVSQGFMEGIAQLLIDRAMEAKDLKALKEDIVAVGQNLKGRLGMIAQRTMYEELACVYFMLEGEPIEYDLDWQSKKKAIWKEERDFFTLEAFNSMNASQNISAKDLLAVWQAVEERIGQLPNLTAKS